jgi:hypothetical protein
MALLFGKGNSIVPTSENGIQANIAGLLQIRYITFPGFLNTSILRTISVLQTGIGHSVNAHTSIFYGVKVFDYGSLSPFRLLTRNL